MITDADIQRAAKELVERYGDNAIAAAHERAEALSASQDQSEVNVAHRDVPSNTLWRIILSCLNFGSCTGCTNGYEPLRTGSLSHSPDIYERWCSLHPRPDAVLSIRRSWLVAPVHRALTFDFARYPTWILFPPAP